MVSPGTNLEIGSVFLLKWHGSSRAFALMEHIMAREALKAGDFDAAFEPFGGTQCERVGGIASLDMSNQLSGGFESHFEIGVEKRPWPPIPSPEGVVDGWSTGKLNILAGDDGM